MKTLEKRDYQIRAPEKVVRSLKKKLRTLIVMATGLGKTITCGLVLQEYFKNVDSYRILYLCDRNLALSQAEEAFFKKLNIEAKSARLYGKNQIRVHKIGRQVIFASFQKLSSAREWYKRFPQDYFDLIVVDEAHHAFAPTYYSIIRYFQGNSCPLLGMTATPYRSDQKDIRSLFGPAVVDIPLEEGIAMGWLAELEYQILSDELDDSRLQAILWQERKLGNIGRRFSMRSLNSTLFIRKRDDEIIKHIKYHTRKGKKTLIFCQSIVQADWYHELLGPAARAFHSKKSSAQNEKSLSEFRKGPVKYLVVVDKLNEAFDMPEVEVVVFLRLTDSKRIFFQQLGRGLRKTRTKQRVLVLDFVANCERLMYLATLAEKIKQLSSKKLSVRSNQDFILDHDTVLKKRTVRTKDQRRQVVYVVEGKSYTFSFTHKTIKMIKLLKALRQGWYPTWEEASAAAIKVGLTTQLDYREKRTWFDPRLPPDPIKEYGETNLTWMKFFRKDEQQPPPGWMAMSSLLELFTGVKHGTTCIRVTVEKCLKEHPEWCHMYYNENGARWKYYAPELIELIKRQLHKRSDERM